MTSLTALPIASAACRRPVETSTALTVYSAWAEATLTASAAKSVDASSAARRLCQPCSNPGNASGCLRFLRATESTASIRRSTTAKRAGSTSTRSTYPVSYTHLDVYKRQTLALTFTSVLAVIAGRNFLHRLPLAWIHRASGIFFLLLAALAVARLIHNGF